MPEPADWSMATFDGVRRRQHDEFYALPLAEKIARLEEMAEVAALLAGAPRAGPPNAAPTHERAAKADGERDDSARHRRHKEDRKGGDL